MERDDELIPVLQAANDAGVMPETLRRWIVRDGIPVFVAGDRRRHLIRRSDFDRLMQPRPVQPAERSSARA